MTLVELFSRAVETAGGDPAVWQEGAWRSWDDWHADASAFAAALQARGVAAGDAVGLYLPNSWEYLVAHVGAALIGAVTLPLHMSYGPYELAHLAERVALKALVAPARLKGRDTAVQARAVLAEAKPDALLVITGEDAGIRSPGEIGWRQLLSEGASRPPAIAELDDDAVLAYLVSSGTSSKRPKICVHTHGGLLGNARGVADESGMTEADVTLSASPFTHAFGLLSVHLAIVTAGRQAILPAWDARRFIDTAIAAQASVGFAVPAQLRDVTALLSARPDALTLRQVRTGGAPVPGELVRTIAERLGSDIVLQWGMSEVGAGTYTRPGDSIETITTTIGRAGLGAALKVVGSDGETVTTGEVGDLYYRCPGMFRGYLGDAELTADAVDAEGWLRTGDLARLDSDGYAHYEGRTTEIINRGGLKYSVVEVENLIAELEAIRQLAVVPRADDRLGQRAVLLVALREGASVDLEAVTEHLRGHGLATYKWPEELRIVDELPTTPTGKIARARISLD